MLLHIPRLLRLALPSLLALLAVAPGPAHAGRASACKAPPFAVPRETQRAVDAVIDARVTGTAAGGLSSTVETRVDYETTTLSQDAVARSWVEYTLCLKLAKKLISQELHDELLRSLLAPATATALPTETAPTVPDPPSPAPITQLQADELVGVWQVTSRFLWSTCPPPQDKGGSYAYTWQLSVDQAGAVQVSVLGKTAFPVLSGQIAGEEVVLQGVRGGTGAPQPAWTFHHATGDDPSTLYDSVVVVAGQQEGGLRGTRDVLLFRSLPGATSEEGEAARLVSCQSRYDLNATR